MQLLLPLFIRWNVNPAYLTLGTFELRYYGLTWAVGLALSGVIFYWMMKREGYGPKMFDSIFWYGILATVIGSRLGHCLFYDRAFYLSNPIEILKIHDGGMASHGAAIGLLVGLWLWSRKYKMPYMWSLDRIGVAVAVAGALVRFGNLMNSEIYGVETSRPWGFIFERVGETVPKHPTQLYEAFSYLILFGILFWLYDKKDLARRRPGVMFGIFLIFLFGVRFLIEFIKNPQEAFEEEMLLNMGQLLSIPFVIAGIVILWRALCKPLLTPALIQKKPVKKAPASKKR